MTTPRRIPDCARVSAQQNVIRYEQPPVLQSVSAYGSETLVPSNDICRLSYYLKCCVVGCGIDVAGMNADLLDYQTAHELPTEQQEQILRYSLSDLNLIHLLNRVFVLDNSHMLLPPGTLNTFFEFKTAASYFSINTFTAGIAAGQQMSTHKVMLCTFKWMKEYYLEPFLRYHQGCPIVVVHATELQEEDEVSIALMLDQDYTQQGMVVTPYEKDKRKPPSSQPSLMLRTCCDCSKLISLNDEPCYRCVECIYLEFCQDCYAAAKHDQTHTFERICRTSIESLSARVQAVRGNDHAFIPDAPLALAVPVRAVVLQDQQDLPSTSEFFNEPVARAVGGALGDALSGLGPRKGRRGSLSSISSSSCNSSYSSRRRRRPAKKRKRRTTSTAVENDRKPAAKRLNNSGKSFSGTRES